MLVPTVNGSGEDTFSTDTKNIGAKNISNYQNHTPKETKEKVISYEVIFKDGMRRTIKDINSLSQIPSWGKHIEYYRDEGYLKGKKLTPESIKTLNLPQIIDINPKVITGSVSSMTFTLGNRIFDISPDLCNIKKISLTKDELVIETTLLIDITYTKDKKLPDLMFKLWRTPKGKWEKTWFRATTVTEL